MWILLVLFKWHVFWKNYVFSYLCFNFIQVSVIKYPMLWKKNLIWQMHWLNICILLIEWSRDISINGLIVWKVQSIIYLFDVYAVILPIVFLSQFYKFNDSNICSFLYLRKQTIIKSRPSIQGTNLLLA